MGLAEGIIDDTYLVIMIQSTLHIVSTLYSEHLHIVNNFGETLQWRFITIVSLCS